MKLFIYSICFLLCFPNLIISLKSKSRAKLDSHIDPFQMLGISDFKKDLNEGLNKEREQSVSRGSLHVSSIADLPKLFEREDYDSLDGFKAMTRFLTEDDDKLFNNGGIYDETGFDGVDPDAASLYSVGSESRNVERAKSAAVLWVKKTDPGSKLEPYSVKLKEDEDLVEWAVYEVILMCCSGNLMIRRVCIDKNEQLAMIAFVLEPEDKCENRVGIADEFVDRGLKYLKKIGMKSLAGYFNFSIN